MRIAAGLVVVAGLLAGAPEALGQQAASSAPPPASTTRPTGMPHWLLRPDANDAARVYPNAAFLRGVGGQAVMACKLTADGSMADCRLLSEQPAGQGFGEAALKLAPHFKMSATTSDGRSVEGMRVRIPMTFSPPVQ